MFTDSFDEFDEPVKKKVQYVQMKIEFPKEPETTPAPSNEQPKKGRGRGKGTGKSKKTEK